MVNYDTQEADDDGAAVTTTADAVTLGQPVLEGSGNWSPLQTVTTCHTWVTPQLFGMWSPADSAISAL
jgi:hypothetical protein